MKSLKELQAQVQRKQKLQAELLSLQEQLSEVERRGVALSVTLEKEQTDVERLTKNGITALFYTMLGKREEMLEKERREAYAAAARYEAAKQEHRQLQAELAAAEEEFAALQGCEAQFEQALRQRLQQLKQADPVNGQRVAELEQQMQKLQNRAKELREAVSAGERALNVACQVQDELSDAENWGTWDMLGGSGLITQMAKHDHLEQAQQKVQLLQSCLHRFKTELADVSIRVDVQARVDGFLGFADWFFDGLFVDWAVQNRIYQAQEQMDRTVSQIEDTLHSLHRMEDSVAQELQTIEQQLRKLAVDAEG